MFAIIALFAITLGSTSVEARHHVGLRAEEVSFFCERILVDADKIDLLDVQGAPGMQVLRSEFDPGQARIDLMLRNENTAFEPHEIISTARYAAMVNRDVRETVLLVPDIGKLSVPGFDGVILDYRGQPIANYSVKTILEARNPHRIFRRAEEGIEQAIRFSDMREWFAMTFLVKDRRGHIQFGVKPKLVPAIRRWLSTGIFLFAPRGPRQRGQARPTRVVVDIQNDLQLPRESSCEGIRRRIQASNGLIEAVIFIKGDAMLEIRP